MIILGLTGSIAMGKSTAAGMFRRLGVPVYDADAAVHRLLGPGGAAVPLIADTFPGVVVDDAVDRGRLGRLVFADPDSLPRLEAILHPLVWRGRARFLADQRRRGCRVVVLDIPLLFETGAERACHAVAVVSAPAFLQRQRLLRRPNMDGSRIAAICKRQMADAEKRKRADYVIPSGLGRALTWRVIGGIVAELARAQKHPAAPLRRC